MGIGFMIFGFSLCGIWLCFHSFPVFRKTFMVIMLVLMVSNIGFQMTPCYIKPECFCARTSFYVVTCLICLGLAVAWRFVCATDLEIRELSGLVEMAFVHLGIGFFFYMKKVPECIPYLRQYKFVQLYLGSHGFWHIFVVANQYCMFWFVYKYNLMIEKALD
jgi:predicted membrane channel-forming protein YqfA (hemolysin III family)